MCIHGPKNTLSADIESFTILYATLQLLTVSQPQIIYKEVYYIPRKTDRGIPLLHCMFCLHICELGVKIIYNNYSKLRQFDVVFVM